ncbi:aminopeptidase Ey isoform X2 [Phlebotomus argentipes]|nr:aminopeptidase Ey isoform X2 [Phlebotomus argentipes]
MQVRETLAIDHAPTFTNRSGIHISKITLGFIVGIFVCGIVGSGFLVYHFISCPKEPKCSVGDISTTTSGPSVGIPVPKLTAADFLLPTALKPHHYELKIQPFFAEKDFMFDGEVVVTLEALEDCKNITLHSLALKVPEKEIRIVENGTEREIGVSGTSMVETQQFFVVKSNEVLKKGQFYRVLLKFHGILNEYMQGFYRSSYRVGNDTRWLAATQFQPTDARRTFPCMDQPDLKARFTISIARPKSMISLSNMKRVREASVDNNPDYLWDVYEESVPMSTYLVAFVVCDFAKQTDETGMVSVWARQDAIKSTDYALNVGPRLLKYLERFFNLSYPLEKMDMIALPDFSAGAMENFGLITYRETSMLYEEGISAINNKHRVATVISHELVHQWFGNLVTLKWWNDLWLNEGFASYMEYLGVDAVEPSWMSMDLFVVLELQNVFALDALSSSHPISVDVANPDEINDIFDRISYSKGATIIRMMDNFLTSELFRRGLNTYLKTLMFDSATQDDLWGFLTDAARNGGVFDNDTSVKVIMDTWTLQTGFPLVTVTRNYDDGTVELQQQRFFLINQTSEEKEDPLWWIPVTYTTSKELNFSNTSPSHWMRGERSVQLHDVVIDKSDWLIVNLQQSGYYRVNYDDENWRAIVSDLNDPVKFRKIAPANRAQLIDDALNLARGGYLSYVTALEVTRYLQQETDYVPWKTAINGLNFLDSMLQKTGQFDLFRRYCLSLLEKVYHQVGFVDAGNSSMLTVYKRVEILTLACQLGYSDCVDRSVEQFNMWIHQPNPDLHNTISPNLKSLIYCTAIKYGEQRMWDFAWERFMNTQVASEKEILLSALGCSREPWILIRYLDRSLTDAYGIRKQDVFRVFGAVASNGIGHTIVFNYLRSNWDQIRVYLGSLTNLNMIIKYSIRRLNTPFELEELKRFADVHLKDSGRTVKQSIEKAEANISWMKRNYKVITTWLEKVTKVV